MHDELLFSFLKEKTLSFTTAWMNLEHIILSEMSQARKTNGA
jgi:hypothetical protein